MFVCYILYSSKLDRYYIGHTEDIKTRLFQHNSGMSVYTSKANDWKVVYMESFKERSEARKQEFEIKRKKSRKYIEQIISTYNK